MLLHFKFFQKITKSTRRFLQIYVDIFENLNFGHLKAFAKISFKKQRNVNILVRCTKSACLRSVTFCNKTSQHFSKLVYKGRYLRKKGFMILWPSPRIWKSRSQIVSSSSYKKPFFLAGFPFNLAEKLFVARIYSIANQG